MRAAELDLTKLYRFISQTDKQEMEFQRVISVPASALGTLRQELIGTLGRERTKGFLLRYGWHCGVTDAMKMKELNWENEHELLLAGPKMHTLHGHVEVEPLVKRVNFAKRTLHFEGHWRNSYEAQEHVKLFGVSNQPECHTLAGYASGYLSTVMGTRVITREVKCQAMGDDHCHWVSKTVAEWGREITEELRYYEGNSIIDELDQTYEQLKIERDNLNMAYDVHHKLLKEVLRDTDLNAIAGVLYQITKMPVLIEDSQFNLLAAGGLTEQQAHAYSTELQQWAGETELAQTTLLPLSDGHVRALTPIYLRQKIIGYCSFLYRDSEIKEVDKLILEHAALSCSLCLLNERTRFHAEQRITGRFLEDILQQRIGWKEIINRSHYIHFKLSKPYFVIVLQRLHKESSIKEELEFNDQLMSELSKFFEQRGVHALFGQTDGYVIILVAEGTMKQNLLKKEILCQQLFDHCSQKYPQYLFKAGISSSSPTIEDASNLYEESLASIKVTHRNQHIVFFDSLGVAGILFQTKNHSAIQKFAYKYLGSLLEQDKQKNMELTKTLYHYMNNSCNVNQTARAMNFSISGLRYRLQRLNEIMQADINSPYNRHQIYLALQSLIVLGELDLDEE